MTMCSICLEPINETDSSTTLACTHTYHYSCLLKWNLQSDRTNHQSCPSCRVDIGVGSEVASFRGRGSRLNRRRSALVDVESDTLGFLSMDEVSEDTDDEMPELEPIGVYEVLNNIENSIPTLPIITHPAPVLPSSSMPTATDQGLVTMCKDCNSCLKNCNICNKFVCNCSYSPDSPIWRTRLYHVPHSPFGGLPTSTDIAHFPVESRRNMNISETSEGLENNNECFCSKCFERRDELVLNMIDLPSPLTLAQRLEDDSVKHLFSVFYIDTGEVTDVTFYERFPTFTWDEFKVYIEEYFRNRRVVTIVDRYWIDDVHLLQPPWTEHYNRSNIDSITQIEDIINEILDNRINVAEEVN
jgi:hypothetical protein